MKLSEVEFRYESMIDEYPDTMIFFGSAAHKAIGGYTPQASAVITTN